MLRFLPIATVAVLLVVAGVLPGQTDKLTAEQSRVLESVRARALAYTHELPDFLCTQVTHRAVTSQGIPATASL